MQFMEMHKFGVCVGRSLAVKVLAQNDDVGLDLHHPLRTRYSSCACNLSTGVTEASGPQGFTSNQPR